jgi:hypothetical protein
MSLAMPHVKELLRDLRLNDWYITAYSFFFENHKYVVVFEDLREIDRGTKYFAVCLTFIDEKDNSRRLETYVNSYEFQKSDEELMNFFGIEPRGTGGKSQLWSLYEAFNLATPTKYEPLKDAYKREVLQTIDHREKDEGFCCYMARHNGKDSHGNQIERSAKNTAKTKLIRESLFNLLGRDKTISFCYRKENEEDDATIALSLHRAKN